MLSKMSKPHDNTCSVSQEGEYGTYFDFSVRVKGVRQKYHNPYITLAPALQGTASLADYTASLVRSRGFNGLHWFLSF